MKLLSITASLSLLLVENASAYSGMTMKVNNSQNNKLMGRREAFFVSASSAFIGASAASAEPQVYLTEPTDEFKESERQRMEFRRAQLEIKKKFTVVLDRFVNTSKTETELEDDLKELRQLIAETGGLPLGIKKDDIVKTVRSVKKLGFWPTNVEVSSLVSLISILSIFSTMC